MFMGDAGLSRREESLVVSSCHKSLRRAGEIESELYRVVSSLRRAGEIADEKRWGPARAMRTWMLSR